MWHPVDKDQNEQLDDLLMCVGVEAGHSAVLGPRSEVQAGSDHSPESYIHFCHVDTAIASLALGSLVGDNYSTV